MIATAQNKIELTAKFVREIRTIFGEGTSERMVAAVAQTESGDIEIKGMCQEGELQRGVDYRFFGTWKTHKTFGPQFCFTSFCESVTLSQQGVVHYLQRCNGIGTARAKAIWGKFGDRSITAIKDESPELFTIKGLTPDTVRAAGEKLRSLEQFEAVTVELHDLLDGSGIPKRVRDALVEKYGTDAANVIRANPFLLMEYSGVGFNLADQLYKNLGLPLDTPDRQGYWLFNAIRSDNSGSVWFETRKLEQKLRKEMGSGADFQEAMLFGDQRNFYAHRGADGRLQTADSREDSAAVCRLSSAVFLADAEDAEAEAYVARRIDELLRNPVVEWSELELGDGLTEHQTTELRKALAKKVGILSGCPGTGKTFTTAKLIRAVGADNVAVCAPTGKAAVRITQMLADAGIALVAKTIHATLVCLPTPEGFEFLHGEDNPLPEKYVIVDEASMLSNKLIGTLLRAIGPDTHLLLVGDPDQLPPVGVGAPLRDFIAAGMPNGHLTEIVRNEGAIVGACHQIRRQQKFTPAFNQLATPEQNLVCIKRITSVDKALRTIIGTRSANDVQLIVAVNKKTPFCLENINKAAKDIWNPQSEPSDGKKIHVGDKVICGKNGQAPLWDDPSNKKYVANGDMGIVRSIDKDGAVIELIDDTVQIPLASETKISMENFSLGYAITAHKCVSPNTIVETPQGLMQIRELNNAGIIGTPNGQKNYTQKFFYENVDCLEITTKDGNSITVSMDHMCEFWNGTEYVLGKAQELQEGQFVRTNLTCAIEPDETVILPTPELCDPRTTQYTIPTTMSCELAELLGLIVADGCLFKSGFRLGKRHKEVADRFTWLCKHLFGIQNNEYSIPNMFVSECQSRLIRQFLANIGGCFPHTKHVPKCIMQSPSTIHRSFLRGLFEDGTVGLRKGKLDHIEWTTCFPRLDREVRILLNRLGIICGRNSKRRKVIQLYIYGREAKKFSEQIGFISEFKTSRLQLDAADNTRYLIPVTKEFVARNKQYMTVWDIQNARLRGHTSRSIAERWAKKGCTEIIPSLQWHHSKIASIKKTSGPVVCVEVPDGNRFMQNGFPWGNSQGSEWPVVVIFLDDTHNAKAVCDRHWLYTAISRAQRECYLIGDLKIAESMIGRSNMWNRKTFLAEDIVHLQWSGFTEAWNRERNKIENPDF